MLQQGDSAGRYRITRQVSAGPSVSTFLALDPFLEREVVLTVLPPSEGRADVISYVRAAVSVQHRAIHPILDYGDHDSLWYLVTLPVADDTLRTRLDRLGSGETLLRLSWVAELSSALAALHAKDLAYGCLDPAVLLVSRGDDRIVLDLRAAVVARITSSEGPVTLTGPAYAAPEHRQGGPATTKADVFSLGAVCYEILTGTPPFRGDTAEAVSQQVLTTEPPPLPDDPLVPHALAMLVMQALSKRPEDRSVGASGLALAAKQAIPPEAPPEFPTSSSPIALPLDEAVILFQKDVLGSASSAGEPASAAPGARALDENVQFTVFRPKSLVPATWSTMLVFAHLSERRADARPDEPDPVAEVARQAEAILGDLREHGRQTVDSLEAVPREGELTIVPHADGITFNPPSRSFTWSESVHREEFRLRADARRPEGVARGRLTVFLGSLIIAEVGLTFRIAAESTPEDRTTVADIARRYRRIFASYSHQDHAIVDEFTEYARAMGDRYLRDVVDLRAGQRWQAALEDLIRQADIFQLFWSRNSLSSANVRHEWQFALGLQRASFIRPVYWEEPLPALADMPPALSAIHFQRIRLRRTNRDPEPATETSRPPAEPEPARKSSPVSSDTGVARPDLTIVRPRPAAPAAPPAIRPPTPDPIAPAPVSAAPWSPSASTPASAAPPPRNIPRSSPAEPAPPLPRRAAPPWRAIGSIAAALLLVAVGATLFTPGFESAPTPTDTTLPPRPATPLPTPPRSQPGATTGRLLVRIISPDVEIVSETEARLVDVDSGRTVADGTTDDDGEIVLGNVRRGRYRLIVTVPDRPELIRDVIVDGDQTIEIDVGQP